MTKLFLIATALLSAATSPVIARDVRPASSSETNAADASARKPASAATRYCVITSVTGTRIPVKTCKTRANWIADDDFDPLAKN